MLPNNSHECQSPRMSRPPCGAQNMAKDAWSDSTLGFSIKCITVYRRPLLYTNTFYTEHTYSCGFLIFSIGRAALGGCVSLLLLRSPTQGYSQIWAAEPWKKGQNIWCRVEAKVDQREWFLSSCLSPVRKQGQEQDCWNSGGWPAWLLCETGFPVAGHFLYFLETSWWL